MKTFKTIFLSGLVIGSLSSCGGDSEATENPEDESTVSVSNSTKNEITIIKYDGVDQTFDQNYVYANYNSMYKSYRVLYLNYDKSEDSDYGTRTGTQQKIVVGLFSPKDGEFQPGKYTWNGDENGMNKIAIQVETAEGMKTCNIAGIDDPGYVEITEVSDQHISGTFHVTGEGFELKGSFNVDHESVN